MSEMVLMPWWTPWLFGALVMACLGASAWFDHYSKRRLREATDYWRRSEAVWAAIDAVPADRMSEEGIRAMGAFLDAEVDQVGSIPTDYMGHLSSKGNKE